jgi:signal transduction histidine kinase
MRWPTTLRSQFVAVVAGAVILSNLAVIAILEVGREGELQVARRAAAVDRIGAMFDYLSTIPEEQRESAAHTMSGTFYHYALTDTPQFEGSDTEEARRIGTDLVDGELNRRLGTPRVRVIDNFSDQVPLVGGVEGRPSIEITQPLPNGGWVWGRYDFPNLPSPAPDLLIAAALGSLLSGAGAAWLAGRVSRPLSALAYASDEVARGRTAAPRLKVRGPDDIRLAAEAFNAMSDRVTRTLESQRQLLSAVGHDLRTPLAAMRITAEFVEDSEVRERLARNIEELQSLTEAVLSAARAGPGEEKRRVDLAALIESVCDDLVELGMPVEVNITGSAPCLCRPSEIRRATRNLIENAARYGGMARVSLATEGDSFVVTVNDNGPGIPQDKLEEVFEPFVRLEASRNAATGGAGLGLTLARSIAKEHGGDVVLENRYVGGEIAGLRASLRLPCEPRRQKTAAVAPEKVAT